ncbi:TetR/AcrR family transcriptional regulator [Streptomyces sp. KMM 9044]|uniref:TetR/AcrR family transcriptional regulator n=1 Tax=Streptomyces sp. KMM 9044 TaxID=2744474 RepID=UPI0021512409|nr:TetR/AcrR family transcriptional regulator [Streptomyces sp. KMM 9044]WAX82221.1 TetR/AcrR family transcriptional regulator [Streptomyces sp. KMM 9044]
MSCTAAFGVALPGRQNLVKKARAARTRCSLIQAAAEVFAEVGFVPASPGAIGERAGFSNGALYFRFTTRSMLAETVETETAESARRITEPERSASAFPAGPPSLFSVLRGLLKCH